MWKRGKGKGAVGVIEEESYFFSRPPVLSSHNTSTELSQLKVSGNWDYDLPWDLSHHHHFQYLKDQKSPEQPTQSAQKKIQRLRNFQGEIIQPAWNQNSCSIPIQSTCCLTWLISEGTPSPRSGRLKVSITTLGATWLPWLRLVPDQVQFHEIRGFSLDLSVVLKVTETIYSKAHTHHIDTININANFRQHKKCY